MSDYVPGYGPIPCPYMLVSDQPNKEDARRRRWFSGKAGAELDRFMDGFHVPSRERWYQTGLIKIPPAGKEPTPEEMAEAEPFFLSELKRVAPKVIVTLGRRATAWFLGDRYGVDDLHGLAMRSPRAPNAIIFPAYNPLAAALSPEFYARFCRDMDSLGLLLKGQLPERPVDDGCGDYRILHGSKEVAEAVEGWQGDVAIDTEGSIERPWSMQFSLRPRQGFVVRAGDSLGLAAFGTWLRTMRPRIVYHFAQHDIPVMRAMGIETADLPFTDTLVMAYVLGEQQGLKPLGFRLAGAEQQDYSELVAEPAEALAREWLGELAWGSRFSRDYGPKPTDLEKALRLIERMLLKDAKTTVRERWANSRAREILQDELLLIGDLPEPTLDAIPEAEAVHYAGRDTDLTIRVAPMLEKRIEAMGLATPLALDIGIIPMVERMERVGMQVDVDYLHDLSSVLADEHRLTVEMICEMAGKEINPASGPQVAEWLFDDLGLPWKKKTKSGDRPATGKKVLESLAKDYSLPVEQRQAVMLVLEAREIQKVNTTFCLTIQDYIRADGRLHPHLMLTRTGTGRTAAKDPNVLAFPKHSARGKLIRGGFVAGPGRMLAEWDLSQIDLRALAIDSGDTKMIEQFNSGHDFHSAGASSRYGLPVEQITKEQRYSQKKINFAIPMGSTEYGLCESYHQDGFTSKTPEQCKRELSAWYADYAGATAYIQEKQAEARRHGFVRNWTGRIRYLEGVRSPDKYAQSESLRQAQATPIQGGARDIVKMWLIAVWKRMPEVWRQGYWVEIILDIHDSIMFELDADAYPEVDRIVHEALAEIQQFVIPITCEGTTGMNWGEL